MGDNAINAALAVVSGVIGLAIVSVLVSPRAQTGAVVTSTGGALANVITAAVNPVTGTGSSAGSDSSAFNIGGLSSAFNAVAGAFG